MVNCVIVTVYRIATLGIGEMLCPVTAAADCLEIIMWGYLYEKYSGEKE
jgi:hypothetical protein